MFVLAVCDKVANKLSYHNAAEGEMWRREQKARQTTWAAWRKCRFWLHQNGQLDEFLKAGNYLLFRESELKGAEMDEMAVAEGTLQFGEPTVVVHYEEGA